MKVLFDGYWWLRGPYSNRSVQREMIATWQESFPQDEIVVLVRGREHLDPPAGIAIYRTRVPFQALTNGLVLPLLGRRLGADAIVAHNFSPWWGPSLVFIHDLMFVDHPEWFTRLENLYFRLMPLTAVRAGALATSSHSEARRITRVTSSACTPVGLGLDSNLTDAVSRRPGVAAGISDYGLVVGRLNVRKNLSRTLRAAVASGRFSPERPIIVVGETSGKFSELPSEIAAAENAGSIVFAGGVSSAELRWLYEHATIFLFLSLDEGFGLPAIEARLFGVTSVVSDIPVFRELLGTSATYAEPTDEYAIKMAINRAFDSQKGQSDSDTAYDWKSVVGKLRDLALKTSRSSKGKAAGT